eukprot:jgi/Bigna1/137133/aug1.37_g11841
MADLQPTGQSKYADVQYGVFLDAEGGAPRSVTQASGSAEVAPEAIQLEEKSRKRGDPSTQPSSEVGGGGESGLPGQTMHWAPTGLLTVGMIMGTGVLALPAAVSGLGYGLGLFLCISFGLLTGYLGTILGLSRIRFHPTATSYASLAERLVGPRFGQLTKNAMMLNWWTVLPLYMLTAIESFRNAFYWADVCYSEWGLVVMALLLLPVQMRSYHSISTLVGVSDFAVIVIIIAILAALSNEGQQTPKGFSHHTSPPPGSFLSRYNNVSAFLFAYQGQSVFLEMMAEMRDHNEWPKALWLPPNLYMSSTKRMILMYIVAISD